MPRAPFLQPTILVTSTRRNITFGDRLPRPVGKPAGLDIADRPDHGVSTAPRTTPDHLAVIQPPTAARLTAGCRLRVDRLSRFMQSSMGEGRGSLLFRLATALSDRALWHLSWRPGRGCRSNPFAGRCSPFPTGHVNAPDVPEPEMPSTGGDHASALARARRGALLSSADEGNRRTGSSMFERTSTRPLTTRFRA
jgi:hypothetical protein